ncbi:MAG: hypothetical protein KatS3mg111_0629 [Pirellulaceae bacterium]|nr:MAG: hypothetical protein KatS3mg111_0629 [Pirellulaceae bacterium]
MTLNDVPLPESVRRLVMKNQHPGLALDKFATTVTRDFAAPEKLQEGVQKLTVNRVAQLANEYPRQLYQRLLARQRQAWDALRAVSFEATTVGPLTLHLSRASSLENAGIALHRVYGFPLLPGTGLKGMARAFAETVWFPTQFHRDAQGEPVDAQEREKAQAAWRAIEAVFGWSPGSDNKKDYKPQWIAPPNEDASVGAIVFHDAWGTAPPRLTNDIVNNHHREYYTSKPTPPPGAWESPNPVYFLTLAGGQSFVFALSLRRTGHPADRGEQLLGLAQQWLIGALSYQGAGAKTHAGYGYFDPASFTAADANCQAADRTWKSAVEAGLRRVGQFQVALATPAFLAGADLFVSEAAHGCDLRPATLRGLLRWWWRTMHAGFVDPSVLRAMESVVFGDTEAAAGVQIIVRPHDQSPAPEKFSYKDGWNMQRQFAQQYQIGPPPNKKTTQGLFYAAYGMDERIKQEQRSRYFRPPGSRWTVELVGRPIRRDTDVSALKHVTLTAEDVWQQATAALWLLTHFGGVGSKSRKGFGSLQWIGDASPVRSLDDCRTIAARFREKLGLSNRFMPQLALSPALGDPRPDWLEQFEVTTPATNAWQAMDAVGMAYQQAAQAYKHRKEKLALGLPRQIHGPLREPMRHQTREQWQRPQRLQGPHGDRHASPVHVHVEPAADGQGYVVRVIAFPASALPNLEESRRFLHEFLQRFREGLAGWEPSPADARDRPGGHGQRGGGGRGASDRRSPGRSAPTVPQRPPGIPKPGDKVRAVLLEERTKKGGWRARHPASGLEGPIVNSGDCPADWEPGAEVELTVQSANAQQISYRYQAQ